jgi:transcriptional regulator
MNGIMTRRNRHAMLIGFARPLICPPPPDAAFMYLPAHFAEDRLSVLHDAIRAHGFATLVTLTDSGLIASHVPLLIDPDRGAHGTLVGHLARPNPQATAAIGEALAIFQGPDGYISPGYYATKRANGKVVPTWNYVAIHAYGPLRLIRDKDELLDIVTRLTHRHEADRAEPWAVSDAPQDFVDGMLNGIIGFEIEITRIQGKWKMSQNRPEEDQAGVVDGLRADGRPDLAELVHAGGAAGGRPRRKA